MKNLNLNRLLLSMSYVLDFVEMDLVGVATNHSKRVAYISLVLSWQLGLSEEERFDIVALAILHDNGLTEKALKVCKDYDFNKKRQFLEKFKDHCDIGEENVKDFPFLTDTKNIIKYHHERCNGSGFYRLKGDEIPIMAQIINFADSLDNQFVLKTGYKEKEKYIKKYLELKRDKWFSSQIIDAFYRSTQLTGFYMDLQDELVVKAINRILPSVDKDMTNEEVRVVTRVFSKIIDYKSKFTSRHSQGLSEKIGIMSDYYNKDHEEKTLLLIAADLHDIGKLTISNNILDKPDSLSDEEFQTMRTHSYYTRVCLESIVGFEKITSWASNHHEKLDGSGYPYGISGKDLDFNSRLMGCVDIYQALTENRPYRVGFSHDKSMDILNDMGSSGLIDQNIINDIELVFGNEEVAVNG